MTATNTANPVPGREALKSAAWLFDEKTQIVFTVLENGGFEARAVGGCVRNTLLGQDVADIDIATTAYPETVMEIARNAGLSAHPTGIDHGTVTLVCQHETFEVTTLRRDVESMGRRAVVAFTTDWAEDAGRRDFTINALYCDRYGELHDPLGGYGDLEARHVRFIGDARERIREDYLRILRFFRFYSTYSSGAPDQESLNACVEEREGISLLSSERLRSELLRILCTPRAAATVALMAEHEILHAILDHPPNSEGLDRGIGGLTRLIPIEQGLGKSCDALVRLSVLAVHSLDDVGHVARRLRLSNQERSRLQAHIACEFRPGISDTSHDLRAAIYRWGRQAVLDRILSCWALGDVAADVSDMHEYYDFAENWPVPQLPFKGADVIAAGVEPGPKVGELLRRFEAWWIASDFPDDTDELDAELARLVSNS